MRKLSDAEKRRLREELREMSADRLARVAKEADRKGARASFWIGMIAAWIFFPVAIVLGIVFLMRDREREGIYMLLGAAVIFILVVFVLPAILQAL